MTAVATADTLRLLRTLLALKTTPRTGWLDRGVPVIETESVADHVLITALIGWITAPPTLDRDRVLKLALVHDLAEAIIGDPPPYDRSDVPADEAERRIFFSRRHLRAPEGRAAKDAAEQQAMDDLTALMSSSVAGEIGALWAEYEAGATPEARFAKDLDRFEAFLQARTYGDRNPDLPLSGFTKMALEEITDPGLSALRDALLDAGPVEDTP